MAEQNVLRRDTQPRRMRYMIGATPGSTLTPFLSALRDDKEVHILKGDDPKLLVVEMTDAHAQELQTRHAGRLIIERDATLNPLDR